MKLKYYLLTVAVFALDHITKWMVRTRMDLHDAIEVVPNYLRISSVRNSGVAFGLFADFQSTWKPYILAAMAVVAVIVILIYSSRMPLNRTLLQAALAITLGGIVGNFADRVVHGFVVDFIEFHIGEVFHWPTFNVADSAITIGIALLLVDSVRHPDIDEQLQHQTSD
jgi:signal peptidase II